jgi:hypothetical protein
MGLQTLTDRFLCVRVGTSAQLSIMQAGLGLGVTIWDGIARHGLILCRPS